MVDNITFEMVLTVFCGIVALLILVGTIRGGKEGDEETLQELMRGGGG